MLHLSMVSARQLTSALHYKDREVGTKRIGINNRKIEIIGQMTIALDKPLMERQIPPP